MDKIELRLEQKGSYAHKPGKQIKVFPFVSNPGAKDLKEDFRSFQGVVGEIFRMYQNKRLIRHLESNDTFNEKLKHIVLQNALSKVETDIPKDLQRILTDLFFDEKDNLIKFHSTTLCYLNFLSSEGALKNLGKFLYETFISSSTTELVYTQKEEENLLNQLMLESLPELPDATDNPNESPYLNLAPSLTNLFKKDFDLLKENKELFLNHLEDLLKFYYFQYFAQLLIDFKSFGQNKNDLKPISFTLDWEILSVSRLNSHSISWRNTLNTSCSTIFTHANVLELLNYIYVDGETIKDYRHIIKLYNDLDLKDQTIFEEKIVEIISIYTTSITNFYAGASWEDCEEKLTLDMGYNSASSNFEKLLYELWYKVKYQFDNSTRDAASGRYGSWFQIFCEQNYLKKRGRLGHTLVFNQELLLFLTRLCVGYDNKIRLKLLWNEFEKRGVHFDENTKSEIIKLYEKINLIEKKSDSGDAQYVKSTI